MDWNCKKTLQNIAKAGYDYVKSEANRYYPWLENGKKEAECKFNQVKNNAKPVIDETSENISKFVMNKYNDALNLSKKVKKENKKVKKQANKKAWRRAIIGTTIGFGVGAATGYVLVKKSQIKESDYVFSDDQVFTSDSLTEEKPEPAAEKPLTFQDKSFVDFEEGFQISTDGTTLISKQ